METLCCDLAAQADGSFAHAPSWLPEVWSLGVRPPQISYVIWCIVIHRDWLFS